MSVAPQFTEIVRHLAPSTPFISPFAMERAMGRPFALRLGSNESAFGPPPKALVVISQTAERSAWYGDPESYDLRHKLSGIHHVDTEQILVASGIDELLGLSVRVLVNPGDSAVTTDGTYPTFAYHVHGYGGFLCVAPYASSMMPNLDALARLARETKAKMVYLANPDNPTGSWYPADAIQAFLDRVPEDCAVILDEAYIEFAPYTTALPLADHDRRLIRMRTFSKVYGLAGLRIGYLIADPDVVAAMNKIRLQYGVNAIAQAAALAALDDHQFVRNVTFEINRGREEYYNLALRLGLKSIPSSANFVCMDFGDARISEAIMEHLRQRAVFVRRAGPRPLEPLLRITVGTPSERKSFARILSKVMDEVNIQRV